VVVQLPPAPTYPATPSAEPTAPPTPSSSPTPVPPSPTLPPVPTPTVAALGSDVIVAYRKSGGIAGIEETLTVHADGTLNLEGRRVSPRAAHIAPADLEPLRALLTSPDFAQLRPLYQAAGADLFVYEVTVPTTAGPRTIETMDAAPTPPILAQVIAELERLRGRGAGCCWRSTTTAGRWQRRTPLSPCRPPVTRRSVPLRTRWRASSSAITWR
jgi:hypothetical protein